MSSLSCILSQYEILDITAQYLSLLDLFRLASTCSRFYALICKPNTLFNHWKRITLCDGRGLRARQEFRGIYASLRLGGGWPEFDEELEVRVWNLQCDAANALPCLKCGLNICEECRFVPRVGYTPDDGSRQRPHHDTSFRGHTILCYCMACDEKVQQELPTRLSELCDCDQYTRWICLSCKIEEDRLDHQYLKTRTRLYWEGEGIDEHYWHDNHESAGDLTNQFTLPAPPKDLAFWCPCGEISPKEGNIRCAWCKRKHDRAEWQYGRDLITPFDHNPCYPQSPINDPQTGLRRYAVLGYSGPIYNTL